MGTKVKCKKNGLSQTLREGKNHVYMNIESIADKSNTTNFPSIPNLIIFVQVSKFLLW